MKKMLLVEMFQMLYLLDTCYLRLGWQLVAYKCEQILHKIYVIRFFVHVFFTIKLLTVRLSLFILRVLETKINAYERCHYMWNWGIGKRIKYVLKKKNSLQML